MAYSRPVRLSADDQNPSSRLDRGAGMLNFLARVALGTNYIYRIAVLTVLLGALVKRVLAEDKKDG